MRTRDLAASLCLAVGVALAAPACVSNPDPRRPTIQAMERQAFGGWIRVTTRSGAQVSGELISVEPHLIRILRVGQPVGSALTFVPVSDLASAELYRYEAESGYAAWGLFGTLSTISHGFFLIFSVPIWATSASIAAVMESRHVVVQYPEHPLSELAMWARFPQGMPPYLDEQALTRPLAKRTTRPGPPPTAAPPPTPDQVQLMARKQAWELTKLAQAAARAGDCAAVLELAGKVQTTDADFYDVTFARDVAIRRCLGLPPEPPAPPPAPPPVPPTPASTTP